MRLSRSVRLGVAVLSIAASLAAIGTLGRSAPASASSLKIKCTGLSGNAESTVSLSGCTGDTGGSSTTLNAITLYEGGTIYWANGKHTRVSFSLTPGSQGSCPAGTTEYNGVGTVIGDSTGSAPVDGSASAEGCINDSSYAITLEPGTKLKLK
jgi:hypothetical protein